jgi:3-phenylpropionate/cinnamic acid dioxygenase small subunit
MPSPLEEKDAIRDVLSEYCFCIDMNRFADMAALFAEDGTWDTAFGKATGRPDIEALVRRIAGPSAPRARPIHAVSNVVIRVDGDAARVQSNWVLVQNSEQGPKVGSGGSYTDEMVKQGGNWLFKYRKIDRFIHD